MNSPMGATPVAYRPMPLPRTNAEGPAPRAPSGTRRRGAVLMTVMVCLALALAIGAAALRAGVARRGVAKGEERRLQAAWLAESGLERASARLAEAPDYDGETWEVPADDLGGRDAGAVLIRVEPAEGQPRRRLVRVRADYPTDPSRRARVSKSATIDLPPEPSGAGR